MAKKPRKSKPKSVMQTDIKDLEVGRALRRLGDIRVTEWEFSDVIPKVKEIAATEVDVINLFKRTANIRVNDWEIGLLGSETKRPEKQRTPTQKEAEACIHKLATFLDYILRNLIEKPDQATIQVSTPSPSEIRFRLILAQRDAASLIGHGGHTASAIRNLMKDAGTRSHFFIDLKILSHEEAQQSQLKHSTRIQWKQVEA